VKNGVFLLYLALTRESPTQEKIRIKISGADVRHAEASCNLVILKIFSMNIASCAAEFVQRAKDSFLFYHKPLVNSFIFSCLFVFLETVLL